MARLVTFHLTRKFRNLVAINLSMHLRENAKVITLGIG